MAWFTVEADCGSPANLAGQNSSLLKPSVTIDGASIFSDRFLVSKKVYGTLSNHKALRANDKTLTRSFDKIAAP